MSRRRCWKLLKLLSRKSHLKKMGVKNGMKRLARKFGIHLGTCIIIILVAFNVDSKINTSRHHEYTVAEEVATLIKEVSEVKEEKGKISFYGWGYDTAYESKAGKCELILQNVETGEALWPKMKKNPAAQKIAQRYVDDREAVDISFEGVIQSNKVKEDNVYEILLRYTAISVDKAGNKQKYERTVTTDRFLNRGEVVEYNPKEFIAPEITDNELKKKLQKTKIFYYFKEGLWVYYDVKNLYYILDSSLLDEKEFVAVHWFTLSEEDLPEGRKEYGFGSNDFSFYDVPKGIVLTKKQIGKYKVAILKQPSNKIITLETGIYSQNSGWVLKKRKQLCFE